MKMRNLLRSTTILLVALAAACGGSGSGSSEPGIEAAFSMTNAKSARNQAAPPAEAGQTFYTAEGKRIDLENGFLSLSIVGLNACPSALSDVTKVLAGFFVGSAYAHGSAVEAPEGVVDVSKSDGTRFNLGQLPAMPGSYCGVELELLPLPQDAPGGDVGALTYLSPCYYPDSNTLAQVPGAPVQPDEVRHSCYKISVVTAAPVVRVSFPSPLTLGDGKRNANITIKIEYDTWFDGVDVPALSAGDGHARQKLVDNIAASFRATTS